MALVVRTWNVFHGNAVPPERRAYLEQMVRLATGDDPDVVCLQEVPIWALAQLEKWSGMAVAPAVARPPRLGPLPGPAEAGRVVTDLNHGLLRSAFTGQANAILVERRHRILDAETIALNERGFRRAQARWLSLDPVTRLAWAKERRVCQAVRIAVGGADETLLVANLHTTSYEADQRIADAELRRAAAQRSETDRVLGRLQRQAQPGAAEEPRRQRIEELGARVAVRLVRVPEAETRGDQLDVRAGPNER